jgi:23S rRNA G2069 N7-methylase RlmK/C1962 C5-methylase RlmI
LSAVFTYLRQPLNRYTFKAPKTRAWVEAHCKGKYVLNLFSGPTRLNGCIEVANDIDPNVPCTLFRMDALDCAKHLRERGELFDVVLLDPPYSYRKSMELYNGHKNSRFKQLLDVLPDILTLHGWVITFGYQSCVMSASRDFRIREICLISHGGAQHDTIATVEERIQVTKGEIKDEQQS